MKTTSKLVLNISDLHVGSTVGLWPKDFISNEGNPIGQNNFQKWLWACWVDMLQWADKVIGDDQFDVVINGDAIDGIHHRTLQVMTPDVGDQFAAVKQILGFLATKCHNIHIIKGTECHTNGFEIALGQALDATKDKSTGQNAWDTLDLEVHGSLYNFAHHISTSARSYLEATAHSTALGDLTNIRAKTGKPIPKVMVRAHRHRHGIWQDGNQMSAICGAWQGLTRFGYKVVPNAVPQPSAIIFDHRTLDKNELPLIHQRIYTAK